MDNKKIQKAETFQSYLKNQLKDPEFKKYYDEYGKQLEISYQILKMRKKKGMSQAVLARKIGTKQGNIARIEAGRQNFSINTLEKIAKVFDRDLKIDFI